MGHMLGHMLRHMPDLGTVCKCLVSRILPLVAILLGTLGTLGTHVQKNTTERDKREQAAKLVRSFEKRVPCVPCVPDSEAEAHWNKDKIGVTLRSWRTYTP